MQDEKVKSRNPHQPGYRVIGEKKKPVRGTDPRRPDRPARPDKPEQGPGPLALFGPDDSLVAAAEGEVVNVYPFEAFGDERAKSR